MLLGGTDIADEYVTRIIRPSMMFNSYDVLIFLFFQKASVSLNLLLHAWWIYNSPTYALYTKMCGQLF